MERDDILYEELKRFNQIGSYVESLSEQMVGGIGSGSGFVKNQPSKFSIGEQDDPEAEDETPVEVTDDELGVELGAELGGETEELGGETEELGGETEDIDITDEPTSDGTEIDVTDIVTIAKGAEEKAGEAKDTLDQQTDKIGELMAKLGDLETKLTTIDTITQSIDELGQKIEQSTPPTQEERLEMISLESGPYSQKPLDYWEQKSEESGNKKGKAEYILTQDEVDDYDKTDVENSFDSLTDEQKEEEEEEIKVLGNQPNK